jgi:hypothetical protein
MIQLLVSIVHVQFGVVGLLSWPLSCCSLVNLPVNDFIDNLVVLKLSIYCEKIYDEYLLVNNY